MTLSGDAKREYQRQWVAKRRAEWFSDKNCVECGSTDQLELDHIDPEQKIAHTIWSWSWERILAEVAKCQVLCRECHYKKTQSDVGYLWKQHGTRKMYTRHGCRCDECRAWNANDVRQRRARNN